MNIITSKTNQKIKDLIKLRDDTKYSKNNSIFYVEGERIVRDTPRSFISEIYLSENKVNDYKDLINKFDEANIYILSDIVFDKVKDTKNSQGIIAKVNYNILDDLEKIDFSNINNIIILDNINDPGNLGTIIRLSEACNISLIIISSDSCSIFNTKVIRACMSSIFREKIYISTNLIKDIDFIKSKNIKIYSTILDNESIKYNLIDYTKNYALVFGNEASGVKKEIIDISDNKIFIPMCGKIESLNVSTAVSTVLYEAMRQNNFYET